MLDRTLPLPVKRCHAGDQENCASPAKISTPRTRSRVLADTTPKASPKRTGPITRTSVKSENADSKQGNIGGPVTRTPLKPENAVISSQGDKNTRRSPMTKTPLQTENANRGPVTRTPLQTPKASGNTDSSEQGATKRSKVVHTPITQVTEKKGNVMHTPVTRIPLQAPLKNTDSSKQDDISEKKGRVIHTPIAQVTEKRGNVIHTPVLQTSLKARIKPENAESSKQGDNDSRRGKVIHTPVLVNESKGSVVHTPVNADVRVTRGRLKCESPNTPGRLTRSGRSHSRTPVEDRKKSPAAHSQSLRTPDSRKKTPTSSKPSPKEQTNKNEKPFITPSRKTKDSPKLTQTPQIPVSSRTTRSHGLVHPTPQKSETNEKISAPVCEMQCDIDLQRTSDASELTQEEKKDNCNKVTVKVSNQDERNSCETANSKTQEKDLEFCDRPSSVSDTEDVTSNKTREHSESSAQENTEEVQREIAKVKKRRSTIGRGRKSGQSFGGRRSLCPALPILSLEDQICNIEKGLPQTSKVSHLLDISIREAMRRLELQCEADEEIDEMRQQLVTNAEEIAGHTAYKIAGLPLEVDDSVTQKINKDSLKSSSVASFLKNRTKELEQEYKCWKTLLRDRKLACLAAEREFREARSGETKIDDDNMKNLTSIQRNLLLSKPNYGDYIKEVQQAREKAYFVMKEVNHTTNVISNFIAATKAVADSCYAAVEDLTFGTFDHQATKSSLKTLLTLENRSKENLIL